MSREHLNELPLPRPVGDPAYLRATQLAHSHERVLAVLRALAFDALRRSPTSVLLEVGCAAGGSALALLGVRRQFPQGPLVTVDPWGGREYPMSDSRYGEKFAAEAQATLAVAARDAGVVWWHWRLPSLDYFRLVAPQGYWWAGDLRATEYALTFLDGEHVFSTVGPEVCAAAENLVDDGWIVVDNVNHQQPGSQDMLASVEELARELGLACRCYDAPDGDVIAVLGKNDPSTVLGVKP